MKNPAHYLCLFIIVTFGVTFGNLLSNYISAVYVEIQLERAISELKTEVQNASIKNKKQQNIRLIKQEKEAQLAQVQAMNKRESSNLGKQFAYDCQEWLQAKRNTPGYTTNEESKKRCLKYRTYINTGKIIK